MARDVSTLENYFEQPQLKKKQKKHIQFNHKKKMQKPFVNPPKQISFGDVSVTISFVGGFQATGQNIDGDTENDPFIQVIGVNEPCRHATISLIWTSELGRTVEFPYDTLFFSSTKSNSFVVSKSDQIIPINKLKFAKNYSPIKEFLERSLDIKIANEHILTCPYKKGYGFKVKIDGYEPFYFTQLFSLGQCKETFKLRLNQQTRGNGNKNDNKKRKFYEESEDEEDEPRVQKKRTRVHIKQEPASPIDTSRVKYLEDKVLSLQAKIFELEQQLSKQNPAPTTQQPQIKSETNLASNGDLGASVDFELAMGEFKFDLSPNTTLYNLIIE